MANSQKFKNVMSHIADTQSPEVTVYGESHLIIKASNGSWMEIECAPHGGTPAGRVWGWDEEVKENFGPPYE